MKFYAQKSAAKSKGGGGKPKADGKEGKAPAKPKKDKAPPQPTTRVVPGIDLDTALNIVGVIMILIGGATLLFGFSPVRGGTSEWWIGELQRSFGWGYYFAPIMLILVGGYLVAKQFGDRLPILRPAKIIGVMIGYVCALMTLHVIGGMLNDVDGATLANAALGGGSVGWAFLRLLQGVGGTAGAPLILIVIWLGVFLLLSGRSIGEIVEDIKYWFAFRAKDIEDRVIESRERVRSGSEIDRGDGLVIRGLGANTAAKKTKARDIEPDEEPELEIDLPPARPVAQKERPAAQPPIIERPPLKINTPQSRNAEVNRVPPPRIIGAAAQQAPAPQPAAAAQASPVQPNAAPATQVSSRIQIQREWALPNIADLLDPGNDATLKEADIRARAAVIEDTLRAFGVPGRVTEVNRGPTITQFGVEPGFIEQKGGKQIKVKVSRIASLADDLALALAAPRIRIEAPVPGRAIVGIEVPNGETSLVSLRDVMESDEFEGLARKTRLRLGLGQDVSGRPVATDLAAMPHLLIAGTTGSGKSVCVNSIIVALLCNNSPEDVRMLMIDPKRVELTGYNGIPHLIAPVIVDVEKTPAVLQWTLREMDTRYRTFAKHGVRNILDFNAKCAADGGHDPDLKKMPYIVMVIDELADLMMMSPDETEKSIIRLAQMARATGIHLILATQRPSVDVVTGLIKANFPARIAFTVATAIDSRVILDSPGAEKLLGRGDMLLVTPDSAMPMRAQGCWLSPKEIDKIVRHWRAQLGGIDVADHPADPITASTSAPAVPVRGSLDVAEQERVVIPSVPADPFSPPPTWDEARALNDAASAESGGSKDDKLFNDAVNTVRMHGKASISLLQRRLRIGYTRAARLIEEMEERGIVGPSVPGQQHREVLNTPLSQ
jgi:S-DNA-T family DNA segregation ATPase FtsK/SpoIIIE